MHANFTKTIKGISFFGNFQKKIPQKDKSVVLKLGEFSPDSYLLVENHLRAIHQ
jgi:hypothetical protein